MSEVKGGRFLRLWYRATEWKKSDEDLTNFVCDKENYKKLKNWEWNEIENYPHIFLSRAPLTFGHSQLVIPCLPDKKNINEEQYFEWASDIIKGAIAIFNRAFKDNEIDIEKEFENLAKLTLTEGKYIKTLILKASADEKVKEEYKVHLVPYFESHDRECQKRYHDRFRVLESDKGGLLWWLGERENEVDKWEVNSNPWRYLLDDIANNDLKMSKLADIFRTLWRDS